MSRIVLLGGMLAVLAAAGATTLAFKSTQGRAARADPIDPLAKHLQYMRGEMALP